MMFKNQFDIDCPNQNAFLEEKKAAKTIQPHRVQRTCTMFPFGKYDVIIFN